MTAIPISDHFLQELRLRVEIEQLVSPYVQLKRSGRMLMGLCPFHNEKTPSFAVYPENNSFYCFGCGAGGDAVTFTMRIENLDYVEAVKRLSEQLGMQLPEEHYDDSLHKRRLRVLAANREAAKFFHAQLHEPSGKQGLDYWLGRKLSARTITHFGLGYAPDAWDALLRHMQARGFTVDELADANLVRRTEKQGGVRYYDGFRHRVMAPILDLRGNVIAFGGRVLDDSKPKYINTSDTVAYKKGRDIYALNFAKNDNRQGQLILAEGYMDVIALHQAGFTNAVACLGTALTREQAQLLSRYAKEVILAYDADEAGQTATRRALEVLGQTPLRLRVLSLSGGKDPDEVLRVYGAEKFRSLMEGAANDIEYRLLRARGELDLQNPAGKLEYLKAAAAILAAFGPMEGDIYASRLAEELGAQKETILTQIGLLKKKESRRQSKQAQAHLMQLQSERALKLDPQRGLHPAAAKKEERLLGLLLVHPDFFARLGETLSAADFLTPFNRALAQKLFARLAEGCGVELELLSGVFDPVQMGEMMRMRQAAEQLPGSLEREFEDCAAALAREAALARRQDVADLDRDKFGELFSHMKK
ncbi:MAG: DNA primase [Oscillospiraceae bacterium]|nr:DNA primase [Oscillospiraceae bacterium]